MIYKYEWARESALGGVPEGLQEALRNLGAAITNNSSNNNNNSNTTINT